MNEYIKYLRNLNNHTIDALVDLYEIGILTFGNLQGNLIDYAIITYKEFIQMK